MAVAFIGPWCAGKTTWGRAYAKLTGSEFVDLDELAPVYGEEIGWSVAHLLARNEAVGMKASEVEWEPVRAHVVKRVFEEHPQAIIAFGASYTSYTESMLEARVETLLAGHSTVLVTPTMNDGETARICWERAAYSRGADWARERADFDSWQPTGLDWRAADAVLLTEGELRVRGAESHSCY